MIQMGRTESEKLVEQAIESLPPRFLRHLENIEVVVEKEPTDPDMTSAHDQIPPPPPLPKGGVGGFPAGETDWTTSR